MAKLVDSCNRWFSPMEIVSSRLWWETIWSRFGLRCDLAMMSRSELLIQYDRSSCYWSKSFYGLRVTVSNTMQQTSNQRSNAYSSVNSYSLILKKRKVVLDSVLFNTVLFTTVQYVTVLTPVVNSYGPLKLS